MKLCIEILMLPFFTIDHLFILSRNVFKKSYMLRFTYDTFHMIIEKNTINGRNEIA